MLWSPGQIGSLTVRNRLVMTPMHLGYCPTGEVTDQLIEFYRVRARGGAGLIIVGGCAIDRAGKAFNMIQLDHDNFITGLQRLTGAIQAEGTKVFAQLYHAGRYASSAITGVRPVAPSSVPSRLSKETPHELTTGEISALIDSFAQAALRAQQAGFDGVEILGSAGYLISQFLSPLTNKRNDRYGGDLRGRMTFPLEVVSAIRRTVGPEFPISFRVAGNDFVSGSNTNAEARIFCQALEIAGVNLLNVTGGWHESQVPQITMNVPQGAYRYLARGIKDAVSIPVIACNRINDASLAEEILVLGDADFIGMARPLLADPELPNKIRDNQVNIIRTCIACNQGCLDNVFRGTPVTCLVNAEAGREAELAAAGKLLVRKNLSHASGQSLASTAQPISQPKQGKKILVVGAGPAGLEFARSAKMRGNQVVVWEERDHAGGQLGIAAAPPGRHDFLFLNTFLVNICQTLNIEIRYGFKATPDNILTAVKSDGFDQVVLATGAQPIMPQIPIEAGANVVQAWMVLGGRAKSGNNVVVVGGGAVGVETALTLAEEGTVSNEVLRFLVLQKAESPEALHSLLTEGHKKITLVEMAKGIGRDISLTNRWSMLADLNRHHIDVHDQTTVIAIERDGVIIETQGEQRKIPADTVILAVGSRSHAELYEVLQHQLDSLIVIGDALKPRKALDAIHDAYQAALSI